MNIEKFTQIAAPLGVLGVKITQYDRLIAEWYSEPDIRRNIYSATKSFTSCAVGFAVQEGLLSLDEKLTDAFPADLPDIISFSLCLWVKKSRSSWRNSGLPVRKTTG